MDTRKDFTYGRLQAWVALDRAIRLAQQRGRQHYDTEALDSSLLMPLQGFIAPPRSDVAVHPGIAGAGPSGGRGIPRGPGRLHPTALQPLAVDGVSFPVYVLNPIAIF